VIEFKQFTNRFCHQAYLNSLVYTLTRNIGAVSVCLH